MEQLEFFKAPNPCVGVCTVDDKGYCKGCMRKREERFNWLKLTTKEQLHVIKLCQQRYRRKVAQAKGEATNIVSEESASLQRDLF